MISIAICDDDRKTTESIERILQKIAAKTNVEIKCESFFDGAALANAVVEQRAYFDLIYLDIEMHGMDGIHTARLLRDLELPVLIVYVSVHEEYWKELFCTEPFRFLSKPIRYAEFRETFDSACRRIQSRAGYFTFTYKKVIHKAPFVKITYFESRGRRIYIHMAGQSAEDSYSEVFYGKMNEVEIQVASMNNRFLRIHQSFLVNFDYVMSIDFSKVVMMDGKTLQISEDRQKSARERFCMMLEDKERRDD